MELEKIGLGIFMMVIVSASFFSYLGAFSSYTTATPDTSFNGTYEKLQEISQTTNQSQNKLFQTGANSQFGFVPTVQSAIDIASLLKSSLGLINQMIQDLVVYAKVKPIVVISISGIITLLFVFAIIRLTMRVNKA